MDEDIVKLQANVKRFNHNRKLISYQVISAPAHVVAHLTGDEFDDIEILAYLSRVGYRVEIETVFEQVSMLDIIHTVDMIDVENKSALEDREGDHEHQN